MLIWCRDDDDINDVASMAGVNLNEESARILATNSELVGTQIRSCKDETFLQPGLLHRRILEIGKAHGHLSKFTSHHLSVYCFFQRMHSSSALCMLSLQNNPEQQWWNQNLLSFVWGTCCFFCIRSVITEDSFDSFLQCCRLSRFLFGLGLNLIHLTILSPPLMNSSVAVWTHWTAGAHINTLWVCLLKAGCQIVLWTKGTRFFREKRLDRFWFFLSFIGLWRSDSTWYLVC